MLPVDERKLYEASLQPGDTACIVTGYPLKGATVTFMKPSYLADKSAWNKLNMAAKMSPDSNIPKIISFIIQLCGPPTN